MFIKADGIREKYMWKTLLSHLCESKLRMQGNQDALEMLLSFLEVFPKNREHLKSETPRPLEKSKPIFKNF